MKKLVLPLVAAALGLSACGGSNQEAAGGNDVVLNAGEGLDDVNLSIPEEGNLSGTTETLNEADATLPAENGTDANATGANASETATNAL